MRAHVSSLAPARPLLKWAGGKRQLLVKLAEHYPENFTRYVEPFVGSGAVFFHLAASGRLAGRCVELCDVNADLIGCYLALRDRTDDVITALVALEREHRRHGDDCYYDVRDMRFNPRRTALFGRATDPADVAAAYPPSLAAMLIFLNRTGFNGLYRLNRSGAFNVPAGRYTEPRICDAAHLRNVADAFRQPGVTIRCRSFDRTIAESGPGDFVYCDPPYAPLSPTANFASYTADGFSAFDQRRLQQAVIAACRRGARVVVSNSSAPEIVTIYSTPDAAKAGLRIDRVPARRAINSRATARGPVDELIISNVPAGPRSDAIGAAGPRREPVDELIISNVPAGPRSDAIRTLRGTRPTMLKIEGVGRVRAGERSLASRTRRSDRESGARDPHQRAAARARKRQA